eukprot:TCONS_00010862-protein
MAYKRSVAQIDDCVSEFFTKENPNVGLGVVIKNSSSYNLEYVNNGVISGWCVEPVVQMFSKDVYMIEPGQAGALMWHRHGWGEFGKWVGNIASLGIAHSGAQSYVEGYISVKARTPGKNHIVCLGFSLGRNRCNKCGIQIRGEDGVLDANGNVSGHGTDPTGNVTDISALAYSVAFTEFNKDSRGISWHEFNEETRALRIKCKMNNENHGVINFEVFDGK